MDNGASSYRRYLDGDDNGLSEIVGDYKDGLILYLNQFVNNLCVAEELTEDTFFRLITKKPKFSGKSSFKSWLYAIGRNIAIDHIRHNSKLINTPIEDADNYISDGKSLEQAYIMEENKQALHSALSKLIPDYRQVLWLVYFEEFSNSEAAVVMKKNARQIKNLLYRAKKSLKSELDKEGFIYEDL
ncbi:MAG: RNA polymerase sigma factor [Oscillospiraceae bacterium]|nr:RNA polymerase sigma factor [Oscillospiraceae bacterium]